MAFTSISAIYDGKTIKLLEDAPVHEPCRVLVTFIGTEGVNETNGSIDDKSASTWADFLATFGTWQESRPIEDTLDDIHNERRSKLELVSM
mgnify:CR=1 FL=1